ncbi:RIMS-binding protein 2-like [Argopecten irradians]|uniref:RIMS-binding protein 2-like n=1 Tax=Argopecten irradians TaxID=31199 RepID=UPI0037207056
MQECMLERQSSARQRYEEEERPSSVRQRYEEERVPVYVPYNPGTVTQTQNRRLSEDKDKQLQRKVSELQTQTQRLERKIALLKTENDLLKKKQDDQRPLEEKIKALKKRNAELAAIARRLEEKAKHLQQENMKKVRNEIGEHDSEYLKKMFARQRAKDLAEHAKAMLSKDREIENLRKKCQELADTLSNTDILGPENSQMYEEKEELVSIIKQAAKERLQMEKQLAKCKPTTGAEAKKLKELQVTNEALEKEITRLEKAKSETERLEVELAQKTIECETLAEEVRQEKLKSHRLETSVEETASKNIQLTSQVSDLQKRLQQLEKVNEECNILRLNLTEAQHECDIAKNERNTLQTKVHDLESIVKTLQESADKLTTLENDYQTTKQKLHEKQTQILSLQKEQDSKSKDHEEVVTVLHNKIEELKESCRKQEQQHKQVTEELKTLQAAANQHPLQDNWASGGRNSGKKHNVNPPNTSPSQENYQPTNINSQESLPGKLVNGSDNPQVDSTKSLDTGFADDDTVELEVSNEPGRAPPYEDPELYEIGKKLTELEAAELEEENLPSEEKEDDSGMESNRDLKVKPMENGHVSENRVSGPGKNGPLQVYIAKYTYDPYQHSPNENPDAELAINTGDYLLVYGEMDEDAFYDGELIDGRRGLVPSNFVEKVKDEDLAVFHAAMAGFNQEDNPGNIQQDLDFDSSEETYEKPISVKKALGDPNHTNAPLSQTEKYLEEIESEISTPVQTSVTKLESPEAKPGFSCPCKLTLDRQLTSSILISWQPPTEDTIVQSYRVYVDGELKAIVKSNERTKALMENVDSRNVHRVSVQCLTNVGQSTDRQCTILIGKDAVPKPTELNVSGITPNSATISWLPGNSNYQHTLSINGGDVLVVKAGVATYTVTGLVSDTDHNVIVSAVCQTEENKGDDLSASIDFRTPAGGLPEPPINIQVEVGPQEGTLLLTWLPVTIDPSGISNGSFVKGYVVYADGRRTKEALGPTNDHIILSADDFLGFIPKQLLVRTVTRDGQESAESQLIRLPQTLIREITAGAAKSIATEALIKVTDSQDHIRHLDICNLMWHVIRMFEGSHTTLTDICNLMWHVLRMFEESHTTLTHICNLMWHVIRMFEGPHTTLTDICNLMWHVIRMFEGPHTTLTDICNLMWHVIRMFEGSHTTLTDICNLMWHVIRMFEGPHTTLTDICNLMWHVIRMFEGPHTTLTDICNLMWHVIRMFEGSHTTLTDICNLMWHVIRMFEGPHTTLTDICNLMWHVIRMFEGPHTTLTDICNLMWHVIRMFEGPHTTLTDICNLMWHVIRMFEGPHTTLTDICNLMWHVIRMFEGPHTTLTDICNLMWHVIRMFEGPHTTLTDICNLMWHLDNIQCTLSGVVRVVPCRFCCGNVFVFVYLIFTLQTQMLNSAHADRHHDNFNDSSSSSELSDILEVEEEDTTSHASVHIGRIPSLDDRLRSPVKVTDITTTSPSGGHKSLTKKQEETTDVIPPVQRIVPAIEITRDSSSDRGNSLSEDEATSPTKFSRNSAVQRDSPVSRSLPSPNSTNRNRVSGPTEDSDRQEKGKVKQQVALFNKLQNDPTEESGGGVKNDLPNDSINNRTSPQDVLNSPVALVNGKPFTDQDSNANDLMPSGRRHPEVPPLDLNVDESVEVDSISGEINPPVDDTRIRLFVALFDYDPISMSPNVDCIDEELPFKEGQIIKIYGDKDQDGFYRGECNNRVGFVPCNMVSEIQVDDADLAEQLLKESQEAFSMHTQLSVGPDAQTFEKSIESLDTLEQNGLALSPTTTSRRMVALYDYDPQELSPNVDSEVELAFRIGDILYIYGDMDDDGFFMAELNGHRGLVPSNFLQDAPIQEDEPQEATSIVSPARSGESLNHISLQSGQDKTSNVGQSPTMESVPAQDWVDSQTPVHSRSVTPDDSHQKKKSSPAGILSKGKNIFKKLTR